MTRGGGTRTPVPVAFPSGVTPTAIAVGKLGAMAITNDGLYAWGLNTSGELGLGDSDASSQKLIPTKVPGEDAAISVAAGKFLTIDLHQKYWSLA